MNRKYVSPAIARKQKTIYDITLYVSRYMIFDRDKTVTFQDIHHDFREEFYIQEGEWKFTLKKHGDGVYLEKVQLKGPNIQ